MCIRDSCIIIARKDRIGTTRQERRTARDPVHLEPFAVPFTLMRSANGRRFQPSHATMWSGDFELEPGEWFGEWLYNEIATGVHIEQHGFMPDRVRAAAERLQRDRPPDERFIGVVPWLDAFNAFTAPGRYIYFGRRLLERCPHEDSAAFVIAHEIAHHDLGHLDLFAGRLTRQRLG